MNTYLQQNYAQQLMVYLSIRNKLNRYMCTFYIKAKTLIINIL